MSTGAASASRPCLWLPGWATRPVATAALQRALPAYTHLTPSFATATAPADFPALALAALPAAGPPAVVLGWSLGSLLALALAAAQPGRVGALVLLAGTPCFTSPDVALGWPPRVLARMQRALATDAPGVLRQFAAQARSPGAAGDAAFATHAPIVTDAAGEWPLPSLQAGLAYLAATDHTAALRALRVPLLWLHGADDAIIPAGVFQRWRVDLAASTQHQWALLPGQGHALPWQAPAVVLAHLLPFLARHAPP